MAPPTKRKVPAAPLDFCPNCSSDVSSLDRFCPACGTLLPQGEEE
jgi:predicted amidophosphoribosyltransferase